MTQIVAHRGSRINCPENTLAAFEEAVRVGADGIELDVHLSKDGEVVVIHDETVDRTTNGTGLVKEKMVAELQELDAGIWFDTDFAGEKIPSLREVFELLLERGYQGQVNVELKTSLYRYKGIEKKIGALLRERNWPFTVMYSSFNLWSLLAMHRVDPKGEKGFLIKKDTKLPFWLGKLPFIGAFHMSHRRFFTEGQKTKKNLRLWTVNEEDVMEQSFAKGVVAIITDKPERALALRREREQRLANASASPQSATVES